MDLPSEATTSPEQIHKGYADKPIHIQDQVGFLKQDKNVTLVKKHR